MKKRPASEGRGYDGRRLRCAALCRASSATAALGVTAAVYAVGRTAEGHRQIVWRMAFYLEGKTSVGTNDLSPKEATQMSYDVKYIGMDGTRKRTGCSTELHMISFHCFDI
jgi:hypothetical protein